jgi:glutathione S-transferase
LHFPGTAARLWHRDPPRHRRLGRIDVAAPLILTDLPMITVHHLNNSRSQRILWLLEELEIPYEVKRYERDPDTMSAPPELKAIHPLGKSPVITDGAVTVAESGAIIEYLLDTYGAGRLQPAQGSPERARYAHFLHYAEGSLMPYLLMALVFRRLPKQPMPVFVRPVATSIAEGVQEKYLGPQLKTHFDYLEAELGRAEWFVDNDFSAADIQMSFPLEAAAARGELEGYPRLTAFLQKVQARPAYLRAIETGGPYDLLK